MEASTSRASLTYEVRAVPVPRVLDTLLNPGHSCANKAASFL